MISIVVCSRDASLAKDLERSIVETIGIEFELILIDNSLNKYNIFQAYNEGVERSSGDILCFSHEDVRFHTQDWGHKVVSHFQDADLGMIGVIGGTALPKVPAPWWNSQLINIHLYNIIQQHGNRKPVETPFKKIINEGLTRDYKNPNPERIIQEAVAIDGMWFCIRKDLFKFIKFDEQTYPGFHCYDIDTSLQVGQYKKVAVVYDILIEHFSLGTLSEGWFKASIAFNKKWQSTLPKIVNTYNEKLYNHYEILNLITFAYWMQSAKFKDSFVSKTIREYLNFIKKEDSKEYYILKYWARYGYQTTRGLMKIVKLFKSYKQYA